MKPRSVFAFKEGTLKGVFWDYVEIHVEMI